MTTPTFPVWAPYAVVACLMLVVIEQSHRILNLKAQLKVESADLPRLNRSNALIGMRLSSLEARDPTYQSSKVLVAWDPHQSRGVVTTQNLPSPAAGRHYQLWVLDPGAQTPVNAGVIHPEKGSSIFTVTPPSTSSPGFAISLEPAQGSPEPTGAILFAVPPGQ